MCLICTKEYNNITSIYCCENRQIKKIPKTLINLEKLSCQFTLVKKIPKTLINLDTLICNTIQIKKIPETIKNLKVLNCDNDVLISPQT